MDLKVPAVRLIQLPLIAQSRGSLSYGQYDEHLPFVPIRYFIVFDVPRAEVRGNHAHRRVTQVLVCVKGSLTVTLDDGSNRDRVTLDNPARGLVIPPLVWATQEDFSADGVLLVLSSEPYEAAEYIRDYAEFLQLVSLK
jgi:UDP-2-acetamido-3-amino-2,3-dideoxy-glucuronate N-acetyltransferase